MTDYVLIRPDGSLSTGDGYPRPLVGCHELRGQMLPPRARDGSMWRLLLCDQSAAMPDEHPLNDVARLVLIGLHRSIEPEPVRGAAALLLVGEDNGQLPIPPGRLRTLQQLARVARSLDNLMASPADFKRAMEGTR